MTYRGIRSREAIGNSRWDWYQWHDVWPGKILPMDIDTCVERKGSFLFVECKSSKDEPIPYGQRLTLEALARQPNTTVVVLWGDALSMRVHQYAPIPFREDSMNFGTENFKDFLRNWFLLAERRNGTVLVTV